ncbi:cardio acceleratory peptide 2b [Anopheles maculipalpis]|uniref:cardio acceleratory peptide 2b n=1 Tax=Anopheles maculipalpis TaxID=1496333 RepID=UPI002158FA6F|nr:cardio acceleratory peptide 2b [Anopheles maculipalpis]
MLASSQVKSPVYVAFVALVLLGATLQQCQAEASEFETNGRINKRGPTVGLFAFPRVGRSDPEMTLDWESSAMLPLETGEDYEDYPMKEMKRQGLVPFPRVGRSGKSELAMAAARYWQAAHNLQQQQQSIVKRAGGSGANSGMWFGPRLGKRGRFGAVPVSSGSSEQQLVKGEQL